MSLGILYLTAAIMMLAAFAYKVRHLRRRWSNPRPWAMCAYLLVVILLATLAASGKTGWIDRALGVPNAGAAVIFGLGNVADVAGLTVVVFWRYPAREAWSRVRWILAGLALVLAATAVLFSFSTVTTNRPLDSVTVYAHQPAIFAMVLMHYVLTVTAMSVMACWCFTWAREEHFAKLPLLRWAMRAFGAMGICQATFGIERLTAVTANWFGVRSLNAVDTAAPAVFGMLTNICLVLAMLLPLCGHLSRTWQRWRAFSRLRPLHRTLRQVRPAVVFVASGKRFNLHHRVRRLVIELNDLRLSLELQFTPAIAEAATRLGREAGLSEEALQATIEAAQLKAACQRQQQDRAHAADNAAAAQHHEVRNDSGIESELAWWFQVARAFTASPIVPAALNAASALAETTTSSTSIAAAPSGIPRRAAAVRLATDHAPAVHGATVGGRGNPRPGAVGDRPADPFPF